MADGDAVQRGLKILAEQIALWEQWKRDKATASPGSLKAWERKLSSWDRRDVLDRDLWAHLRDWAKRTGQV